MKKLLAGAAVALAFSLPQASAAPLCSPQEMGFAGLFAKCNSEELPELTVAAGKPLSASGDWSLQSGAYYEVELVADGSQELTVVGPEFFRAIWIDEIVINDLEVRPLGLDSIEFDDEGTVELGFVAIRPGQYELRIAGARGDSQKVKITIQ